MNNEVDMILAEESMLPDIPNILVVLESMMQEFNEYDDWSKISKRELAQNYHVLLDTLIDFAKFSVALKFKVDLLDKAMARRNTEDLDPDDCESSFILDDKPEGDMFV